MDYYNVYDQPSAHVQFQDHDSHFYPAVCYHTTATYYAVAKALPSRGICASTVENTLILFERLWHYHVLLHFPLPVK